MTGAFWPLLLATTAIGCATIYVRSALRTEAGRRRLLPVLRPVMRVMNPRVIRAVDRQESDFGVLHHIGRRSGVPYHTPVAIGRTPEGVLIPLMYGPDTDWCRNIVAAGHCTLTVDGEELALTTPEVLPAPVAETRLSPEVLSRWRGEGIARYLSLQYEANLESAAPLPASAAA